MEILLVAIVLYAMFWITVLYCAVAINKEERDDYGSDN